MDIKPVAYKIIQRPAFHIAGRQTFISGPDNDQFGRFIEIPSSGLPFEFTSQDLETYAEFWLPVEALQ